MKKPKAEDFEYEGGYGSAEYNDALLRYQNTNKKGIIRYYTDEGYLDFTKIGKVPAINGYVDIATDDNPMIITNMNKKAVTKIEIIRYGNRKNIKCLAAHCEGLKEFKVSAIDESQIEDMYAAFIDCTNLEIFDETLDFQKCKDFTHLFYRCDKLILSSEFRERLNKQIFEKQLKWKN